MLYCGLLIFLKLTFSKDSSKCHFVVPDLGLNNLQRLSADDTIRQRVEETKPYRTEKDFTEIYYG